MLHGLIIVKDAAQHFDAFLGFLFLFLPEHVDVLLLSFGHHLHMQYHSNVVHNFFEKLFDSFKVVDGFRILKFLLQLLNLLSVCGVELLIFPGKLPYFFFVKLLHSHEPVFLFFNFD